MEIARRALRRVLDRTGHPLIVQVELPGRMVDVGVWRIDVGRVPLLLLDTDLHSNDPADRPITHILYVRGREMRLCQEIVLGVGGARVIDALGWKPSTWHINEGHAAFSLLQRVSRGIGAGLTFDEAAAQVREHTVFTLHTPLPAGNETFDLGLVQHYLGDRLHGIDAAALARVGDNGHGGVFDMGALAIRLSAVTNGVSKRHAEVVTRDWQHLIGGPSKAVTNGVHLPTWVGGVIERRFAKAVGPDWAQRTLEPAAWEALRQIPDKELWDAHQAQKQRLLRQVRTRQREQEARHGEAPDELRRVGALFDADRLTLVFARRFAAYKRVGLLLSDMNRLQALLSHPERPIQIVFGGKAHPADREGQDLIRRVVQLGKDPRFEGLPGLRRGLRHGTGPVLAGRRRRLGEHAPAAHGGQRHLGHEGGHQRRAQPVGARRVVARGLPGGQRLGLRRADPRRRRRRRHPLRHHRAPGRPPLLRPRRGRGAPRLGGHDEGGHDRRGALQRHPHGRRVPGAPLPAGQRERQDAAG